MNQIGVFLLLLLLFFCFNTFDGHCFAYRQKRRSLSFFSPFLPFSASDSLPVDWCSESVLEQSPSSAAAHKCSLASIHLCLFASWGTNTHKDNIGILFAFPPSWSFYSFNLFTNAPRECSFFFLSLPHLPRSGWKSIIPSVNKIQTFAFRTYFVCFRNVPEIKENRFYFSRCKRQSKSVNHTVSMSAEQIFLA